MNISKRLRKSTSNNVCNTLVFRLEASKSVEEEKENYQSKAKDAKQAIFEIERVRERRGTNCERRGGRGSGQKESRGQYGERLDDAE